MFSQRTAKIPANASRWLVDADSTLTVIVWCEHTCLARVKFCARALNWAAPTVNFSGYAITWELFLNIGFQRLFSEIAAYQKSKIHYSPVINRILKLCIFPGAQICLKIFFAFPQQA